MVELDIDASIDLITKSDLKKELESLKRDLEGPYNERVFAAFSAVVPAAGPVGFRVYDVPDGKTFYLYKFIAWGDAHNPSTGGVYNNAAAWCGLFHGQPSPVNLADFWPYPEAANGQVLPFTKDYNKENGPEFRQNDNVYFQGTSLVVGENVTLMIYGGLQDLEIRQGHQRKKPRGRGVPLRR